MIPDDEMRIMRLEARVKELLDEVERLRKLETACAGKRHTGSKGYFRHGDEQTQRDPALWAGPLRRF